MYEDLLSESQGLTAIYRQHLEALVQQYSFLQVNFSIFDNIYLQGIKLVTYKGIFFMVGTNVSDLTGITRYYLSAEKKTLSILQLMSRKLKVALERFPTLRLELGVQLYEFVTTFVFN